MWCLTYHHTEIGSPLLYPWPQRNPQHAKRSLRYKDIFCMEKDILWPYKNFEEKDVSNHQCLDEIFLQLHKLSFTLEDWNLVLICNSINITLSSTQSETWLCLSLHPKHHQSLKTWLQNPIFRVQIPETWDLIYWKPKDKTQKCSRHRTCKACFLNYRQEIIFTR